MSRSLSYWVAELTALIEENRTLDAMERFYADTATMQENETPARVGKAACLEHERRALASVTTMTARLLRQAINEQTGVVFSEWQLEAIYTSGKRFVLTEVSVQQWDWDKELIQSEKFYYSNAEIVS